ncbi:conserved protein, unknown function [Hepatocystis sp. ex Piliocolobus tephrosceles]|nr:conserved protein, unknown function [Hepatocystis sp. ex Piliocolobus tephrosceles]
MSKEQGAYLFFDNASSGSLFIVWKKTTLDNALIFVKPTKAVPEFKYTSNCGKSELLRNLQSDKKLFYSGICRFIKEGRDVNGELLLLPYLNDSFPIKTNIYFLKENNVTKVTPGKSYTLKDVEAVCVLPNGSNALNVKTMKTDMFVSKGNSEGASIRF